MQSTIDNTQDVLDSREIIGRIEELEAERADLVSEATDDTNVEIAAAKTALADWDEDNLVELDALKSLAEQASSSPDWQYGETLVRDSHFTIYAEELAEDCGMLDHKATWPYTCIDWDLAVRDLKMDYYCVDFDGIDYWVRA